MGVTSNHQEGQRTTLAMALSWAAHDASTANLGEGGG
jgi:hypothetical protein